MLCLDQFIITFTFFLATKNAKFELFYPEFVNLSSKIFAMEDGEKKIQLIKVNFI